MVMIIYNEALDNEVMDILKDCKLGSYSKVSGTFGTGKSSGSHMGTDIWPGLNNILYVACESQEALGIVSQIKSLRKSLGHEGIKAFILPIEEVT
jgi:hypothetical protein